MFTAVVRRPRSSRGRLTFSQQTRQRPPLYQLHGEIVGGRRRRALVHRRCPDAAIARRSGLPRRTGVRSACPDGFDKTFTARSRPRPGSRPLSTAPSRPARLAEELIAVATPEGASRRQAITATRRHRSPCRAEHAGTSRSTGPGRGYRSAGSKPNVTSSPSRPPAAWNRPVSGAEQANGRHHWKGAGTTPGAEASVPSRGP
jgi:hypothetical protein